MRFRVAPAVLLSTLTLVSCAGVTEHALLTQFFAASRLRDLTALQKVSAVVFEPATDGIVTSFDIASIAANGADAKAVSIVAPVRLPDGRTVAKRFVVTIERNRITAISERLEPPSAPRP